MLKPFIDHLFGGVRDGIRLGSDRLSGTAAIDNLVESILIEYVDWLVESDYFARSDMRVEQFLDFRLKLLVINRFCVPQLTDARR